MANPVDMSAMLYEMATIGITMSIVIVLTWTITLTLIQVMPENNYTQKAGAGEKASNTALRLEACLRLRAGRRHSPIF